MSSFGSCHEIKSLYILYTPYYAHFPVQKKRKHRGLFILFRRVHWCKRTWSAWLHAPQAIRPSVENSHECVQLPKKREDALACSPNPNYYVSNWEIRWGIAHWIVGYFFLNSRWLEDLSSKEIFCMQLSIEEACSLIDDNSWGNVMVCVTILLRKRPRPTSLFFLLRTKLFRFIKQETSLCVRAHQPLATLDGFNGRHLRNASLRTVTVLPHNRPFSCFTYHIFLLLSALGILACSFLLYHPLVRINKTLNSEPKVSFPCWALLAHLRTIFEPKKYTIQLLFSIVWIHA